MTGRGLDAEIFAKDAMRHFWKIANRVFVACDGKIFWGNCFGKYLVKLIIAEVKIFAEGVSREGGWQPTSDGAGSAGAGRVPAVVPWLVGTE